MQKITPFLWFDHQALEAANFYVAIFANSKVHSIAYYGEGTPAPAGTVMTVGFTLEGQEFVALNGGPVFTFSPAISLVVNCESQAEIDWMWEQLTTGGGAALDCGWLKDKYGVSWQIVPTILKTMMTDPDSQKSQRVMQALLQMRKLDIAALEHAYQG